MKIYRNHHVILGLIGWLFLLSACSLLPNESNKNQLSAPQNNSQSQGYKSASKDLRTLVTTAKEELDEFWRANLDNYHSPKGPIPYNRENMNQIDAGCYLSPDNAFYCAADDTIYYDMDFLNNLLGNGDFVPVMVMAHEWGHAIQAQMRPEGDNRETIVKELEADCLAGAYTKWSRRIEGGDFEEAASSLYQVGDTLALNNPQAHGYPGERLGAFTTGRSMGVKECWNYKIRGVESVAQATSTPQTIADSPTATPVPVIPTDTPIPPTQNSNLEMILIPAGEFTMGSDTGRDNEKPMHTVYLNEYFIDKYETTNSKYSECVVAGKCTPPADFRAVGFDGNYYDNAQYNNYPIIHVDWWQAKNYCEYVEKRLPTESEWEKAARGTDGRTYPWGNETPNCDRLNYHDGSSWEGCVGHIVRVGLYPTGASSYGVMDMAGNVWEWVSSEYKPYPYKADDGRENNGILSKLFFNDKVVRGSAYHSFDSSVYISNRFSESPNQYNDYLGFRCAK